MKPSIPPGAPGGRNPSHPPGGPGGGQNPHPPGGPGGEHDPHPPGGPGGGQTPYPPGAPGGEHDPHPPGGPGGEHTPHPSGGPGGRNHSRASGGPGGRNPSYPSGGPGGREGRPPGGARGQGRAPGNGPGPTGGGSPQGFVPAFEGRRLLLVVTGSAFAAALPFWMGWLRNGYPALEVSAVLTQSAQRFVTWHAVEHRTTARSQLDVWPEEEAGARHVDLQQWADSAIVYPATLHYTGRLAQGLADSPSLLALQCTRAPVAVAPALPPGGMESAAFRAHWEALSRRRNLVMIPPEPGLSVTTGQEDAWVPPPLPEIVAPLERRRAELAEAEAEAWGRTGDPNDPPGNPAEEALL